MKFEFIKGVQTEVEVVLKNVKYDSIKVKTNKDGEKIVILTFSNKGRLFKRKITNDDVLRALNEKKVFIARALSRESFVRNNNLSNDNTKYVLFGNVYNCYYSDEYSEVKIENINNTNNIYASNLDEIDKYALNLLINRFREIENKYNFPSSKLYIHNMKSRWGVCYIKEHKIGLTKALIHVPLDCVDYVILHEFTHYKVSNHSAQFHNELSKYLPNERTISKKLKAYTDFLYLKEE